MSRLKRTQSRIHSIGLSFDIVKMTRQSRNISDSFGDTENSKLPRSPFAWTGPEFAAISSHSWAWRSRCLVRGAWFPEPLKNLVDATSRERLKKGGANSAISDPLTWTAS